MDDREACSQDRVGEVDGEVVVEVSQSHPEDQHAACGDYYGQQGVAEYLREQHEDVDYFKSYQVVRDLRVVHQEEDEDQVHQKPDEEEDVHEVPFEVQELVKKGHQDQTQQDH